VAVSATEPVASIEGIGPVAAEAFNRVGVFAVFDLLRTTAERLHPAVAELASLDKVKAWRAMASLLQVDEVSPQWAEALVGANVTTIEELHDKTLDQLSELFRAAKGAGTIPAVPTPAQIAAMMADAAVLRYSGALIGTVMDAEGERAAGATVHLGTRETTADERGRFRFIRVPLGRILPLRIEHAEHVSLQQSEPPISRSVDAFAVEVFRLSRPEPGQPSVVGPALSLSELDGDVIPTPAGQPVREMPMDPAQLRPNDILMVNSFYKSAPDVKLVSRFKSYIDGEIRVHTLRIPVAELPAGTKRGDHFRHSVGQLMPIEMSTPELQRLKVKLRVHKALGGQPLPASGEERRAAIDAGLRLARALGMFGGSLGG
jgi:hypothetical protein